MSSANGTPDWPNDEAYLTDLVRFIGERTGLDPAEVRAAEHAERLYAAACYRGFGGPIMDGFETVDFAALNAKYPDLVPAEGYWVHANDEDRLLFLAGEALKTRSAAVEFVAALMAFRCAAGIATSDDEDVPAFRAAAEAWLVASQPS
jgi:hypothetical protein